MAMMARFTPGIHQPATEQDRRRMEDALWEGWELMVDPDGVVWIGAGEEQVARVRTGG